ncbi:hypothetical protein AX769_02215 [Frondihabitans sp. PAMC 28766]|uniref:WXG100 family type VII secretion target n=1 Tax=Frondihabitans sp. PAMC 28766 TaxID=1795630 RepID=UPI00078C930E|nr:WXG100 family type VII secretion target [Frondihabitans sp. PAMC 28766]AMM19159.1 hypothetical protein AX769_02215 [Frondihabitans sp. PAMC 28766]
MLKSELTVSTDAVESRAAAIGQRVMEFESRVSALNCFVMSMVGSSWSGPAADAFAADYVEWFDGAREVCASLDRVSSLLASASQTYGATEADVTHASQQDHVAVDFIMDGE